jgi:hypothetical protein
MIYTKQNIIVQWQLATGTKEGKKDKWNITGTGNCLEKTECE